MLKPFLFTALFLSAYTIQAQWLQVTSASTPPYNVPEQLIRDHLTGPGIEILDVQFDGAPGAVGYFTGGNLSIGLNRGLLLTTGRAASEGVSIGAAGLGTDFASTDNGISMIDPILDSLATDDLHDLTRYKITFRASSDSIRFRYVFASEEYPEYSCSDYNDIFGFFLEGPGYPSPINIARVPSTNLPVSINNVHPAYGMNCPGKNLQYFNNNNSTNKQPAYDGYLDIFVAEAAVQPCGIYTMTLAIADVADGVWDSGVFLEAKSFGSASIVSASFEPGSAVLPENAIADTVSLMFNSVPPELLPLTVVLSGTAQNGIDYQLIDSVATITTSDTIIHLLIQPLSDTLTESFETVVLNVRNSGCFSNTFTLFIADPDPEFRPMDTLFFAGAPVMLTAPSPTSASNKTWSFSNDIPLTIDPVMTLLSSTINTSQNVLPMGTLSDLSLLESVCINVEHSFLNDLDLYLFAPNGQFVELTTDNGGTGDNYTNTCFSPAALVSITNGLVNAPASAAPFTGTFQPEGDWNDLLGAPINGDWKLGLIDDVSGFIGQLLNWSLTFAGTKIGDFHYLWNTGDTTPTISATEPGIYKVKVSNEVGSISKTYLLLDSCVTFIESEVSICANTSYTFGGEVLTTSGIYTEVLSNANGCDSVLTLTLTILPPATDSLVVALPTGGSYDYNGETFTEAGVHTFHIPDANGCDSVFTLILTPTSTTGEAEATSTLFFSPNPAMSETQITWNTTLDFNQLRVFDINGRLMLSQKIISPNGVTLKTTSLASGWYSVQLEGQNGERASGRLLVKK